ncbi:MAG: electron transport complex subunit RsxC [Lawsonibacter sp.]|jgi:electron transport complex protein RnfC|nr:electron transport complex subunit RsxC [Lawsonibacter sp.]
MTHSFFGGVFPATRKGITRRKPIARLAKASKEIIIPLVMCADGPATPLVSPGDAVTVGQPIARRGETGASAHATVSGRVSAIEDRPHPWGGLSPAIVIQNDDRNEPYDGHMDPLDPRQLTLRQAAERVEAAGVVGMGGGAFPTQEKLLRSAGRVDTLIVNAAECEPYVTADYRLLLERSEHILRGAQALARCLSCQRVVVVTEGDKLSAVEAVERRLRRRGGGRVQILTVRTRYPLGAEKQIIQTVTGREVPPGGSPLDVRCAVFNVATVYAIHDALFQGRPLTYRVVTVTGGAVTRPRNMWVPIGTPLRHLLEACGGLREETDRILIGGPMMGTPVTSLEAPVTKDTNSMVCLASWEHKPDRPAGVCIRCGKCVASCPMHLAPTLIRRALEDQDLSKLARYHLEDCNACGCCSFICPAQIPLVETVAQASLLLKKGGE